MADTVTKLPLPDKGEIVGQGVLESPTLGGTFALSRGFGGTSNPSTIWDTMVCDRAQAFFYYRELEEKDDDVGSALRKLKLSVLKRERHVAPKDDSSQAAEAAAFVQAQFEALPNFHQILHSVLDAPGYGVTISEIIYDVSASMVAIADIRECPQELFSFGAAYAPQVGALRFLGQAGMSDGELMPDNKFLVMTHEPRNRNRRGRPLLRSVFWPSWIKRNVLRNWLRFGEKGTGTVAVQHPSSATAAEQQKALDAAEAIVNKIAVAVPENFKIVEKLLDSARSLNPDAFDKLHAGMQYSIARRILGQTLTSFGNEGGTGSKAQGTVHQDVEDEISVELCRALEAVINTQLVKPLVWWNFGPKAPMPLFAFNKEREDDLGSRVTVDDTLQQMGVEIPKSYVLKKYSIPEMKPGDEPLVRMQTAQPNPFAAAAVATASGATFASVPREVRKNVEDMNTLIEGFKSEASDLFVERMKDMAEQIISVGSAQ